ncbi:MAG: patatin-like phospholipase family protein [Candidatus Electrothrix scaldis]|nr:MAG: patatin-like phospholipase family protein [Candidatus Electrothrix sp. GW3-3]
MNRKVHNIVTAPGKKKILAIDAGGTRGVISFEILARMEAILREELGASDDFVLADYFDFFAGTSASANIACFLSLGLSIEKIRALSREHVRLSFAKNAWHWRWRSKFDGQYVTAALKKELGEDMLLGTDALNTLLMLVMRNAQTESPWPVTNNPYAMFNKRDMPGCNLDLPLWQLVRASSAAPPLFSPQKIQIGEHEFVFEDGAISPYSNPAFIAFLQATVEPYNICWKSGIEDILLVSVGNGRYSEKCDALHPMGRTLLENAKTLPISLLRAANDEQDMLCRVFGHCLTGPLLDSEIGDLINSQGPVSPKLFTYIRYNFDIDEDFFQGIGMNDIDMDIIRSVAAADHLEELEDIGTEVGKHLVSKEHYQNFLFKNTNNV